MRRTERTAMSRRLLPLLFTTLLLSACGGGGDNGPTAPASTPGGATEDGEAAADPELDAWMGDFCAAYDTFLDAWLEVSVLVRPAPDPTTEADRAPLLDFLTAIQTALATGDGAAADLPEPPVPAGNDVVDHYRADLEDLRVQIAEYENNALLLPADALDNVYILSGMEVVTFLPGGEDMSEYLADHSDLAAAHERAPACGN
ncbi:hypothetical protein [Streptomyces sp. B6B3]|uniref:hypothetical protein n=1 Tax=Streptomyces sp. B6B3 TaxID=3153570 RepID=UPI00325F2BFD